MPAASSLKPVQTNLFGADPNGSKGRRTPGSTASTSTATTSTSPTRTTTTTTAPPASERPTHIEVCARIRPLQISMQSSSSYFGGGEIPAPSPTRKPPVPNSRIGMGNNTNTSSAAAASQQQQSNNKVQHHHPSEDLFYAWDVIGNDTANQSPKTDIISGRTHSYTLDKVYDAACSTKQVYEQSVKPLVQASMEGYHSAVLAYGQTSTGKTFSMTGTPSSPGIIPLAIHECFQCLEKNREYLIRVSYLEVYKEQIRDLLAEGASQIRLFDHREQGLIIKGLREEVVTCPKQIFEILAMGEKRRKIGATNMNQHSSRSHVMVRLWIESRAITSGNNNSSSRVSSSGSISSMASSNGRGPPVRVSSLSLVDLAGSESVRLHGADETRRQEGHYINKSLMALGKVVYALSEQGKQKDGKNGISPQHIPYRDSKLTRLLQPSLSGNAQMVLICCISPLASYLEESHNTFKFATRAKKIPQKATIQESVDEKTLLQTYREEIEALKQQLKDAKKQQEALMKQHQQKHEPLSLDDEDMDDEVQELKLAIRNMEHLILKSKAATPSPSVTTQRTFSDDDFGDTIDDSDDENDEAALLALMNETQSSSAAASNKAPQTPPAKTEDTDRSDDMYNELHRIQGLLGSVLAKRGSKGKETSSVDGVGLYGGKNAAEVTKLRAQLEQQEVASSLRKADAHFLQKQLEEKDDLLQEVSKILEQVEQRQVSLEAENTALKKEVAALKAASSSSPSTNGGSPIVEC